MSRAALFPGTALARGAHPPVDAALHLFVHGVVVAALVDDERPAQGSSRRWPAQPELRFVRKPDRTIVRRKHVGPMLIQRPLFLLAFSSASFFYAMLGAIVCTWVWASISIFLDPIGTPVPTSAFELVTWLMLLGQYGLTALVPFAPADADSPEKTLGKRNAGLT